MGKTVQTHYKALLLNNACMRYLLRTTGILNVWMGVSRYSCQMIYCCMSGHLSPNRPSIFIAIAERFIVLMRCCIYCKHGIFIFIATGKMLLHRGKRISNYTQQGRKQHSLIWNIFFQCCSTYKFIFQNSAHPNMFLNPLLGNIFCESPLSHKLRCNNFYAQEGSSYMSRVFSLSVSSKAA